MLPGPPSGYRPLLGPVAAGDDPAAQHAVKLAPRQAQAGRRIRRDLGDRHGRCGRTPRGGATAATGFGLAAAWLFFDHELLERVPGLAVRALSRPAQGLASAFAADERHRGAWHDPTLGRAGSNYKLSPVNISATPGVVRVAP